MRRREVITLLGGAAAAWPLGARAEVASKRPLIAWLSGGTAQFSAGFVDNFLRGMRDLGYIEGRNFDMVYRFADGYGDRLPALTDEVVRLKPMSFWLPRLSLRSRRGRPHQPFRSCRRRSPMRFISG